MTKTTGVSASPIHKPMVISARVRVLIISVVAISSLATAVWLLQRHFGYYPVNDSINASAPAAPVDSVSTPETLASPQAQTTTAESPADPIESVSASPTPYDDAPLFELGGSYIGRLNLAVPVKGVKPEQLLDTFGDARSEGRVHDAIDISAPAGTPVIAVAEGEIIKLFESERGGITIYQASKDKKLIFYYAHLQRYADGLAAGKTVWQGESIGYVGDTGNAGAGNYHLHFSIMITKDPKRYWEGNNINPYPLLRRK